MKISSTLGNGQVAHRSDGSSDREEQEAKALARVYCYLVSLVDREQTKSQPVSSIDQEPLASAEEGR
jgi:hypothetical protein